MSKNFDLTQLRASETLGSKAASQLREAISRGSIPAGEYLRLDDLAGQFGISRIPLRDALRLLEKEGLVAITPYRGAKVLPLTLDEAREHSEVSRLLHAAALKHAFPGLTPAILDTTDKLIAQRQDAQDTGEWLKISTELVNTFYGPANRPFLVSMITFVNERSQRYLHLFQPAKHHGAPRMTIGDVVAACRRKDLKAAIKAVDDAHDSSWESLERAFKKLAQAPKDRRIN